MKKILLIKSGNLSTPIKGVPPPLGLMYLAAYISRQKEHVIKIFDIRLYKEPFKELLNLITEFKPDIVGISALTLEAPFMYKIAHFIKLIDKNVPIIVGGPHASSVPEEVVKNRNIDIVVSGEGEITFDELIEVFSGERQLENVDGICFRINNELLKPFYSHYNIYEGTVNYNIINIGMDTGGIVKENILKTRQRTYIEELDKLPFPAWDLVELDKYAQRQGGSRVGIRPYMLLLTSRGCPFHCTYCHNIFGKSFRARSPHYVLEEIETLIKKYNIKDFEIIDDISNFDKIRFKTILNSIIAKRWEIRLSFSNGVRVDLLDEEIIHLMKKAGTAEVVIAIETASYRLQKYIRKNLNIEKVKRIMDSAVNSGMFVTAAFMLGFPTETKEEMKATIDLACKSKIHVALFFIVTPFGGTELARQIEELGRLQTGVRTEDLDYHTMLFNVSNVSDKDFRKIYRWAYIRFYFNLVRIIRIVLRKPMLNDIFRQIMILIKVMRISHKGNKRFNLNPVDLELNKNNADNEFEDY